MALSLLLLPYLTVASGLLTQEPTSHQPERFCEVPSSDDDLLALVNKSSEHALASGWAPDDLVELSRSDMMPSRSASLRAEPAAALSAMLALASEEGHTIRVRSAFRSFAQQKRVFRSKVRKYGKRKAERLSARPGHSQHQLGTTVDLVMPRFDWRFSARQAKTPAGAWLENSAHRFGFVLSYPRGKEHLTGYSYEPWHYRYIGESAATEMHEANMPLEEYLRACEASDPTLQCGECKIVQPRQS